MDTSQFVSQAEPFLQELEREFYLVGAGRKEQLQIAPIYDRYPLLFSREAVQARLREHTASPQSTTARYLASFAVDGYLEDRVKSLSEEITNAELSATVEWDGETVAYRQVRSILAEEPDQSRRHDLHKRQLAVTAEQHEQRAERFRILHEEAEALGFQSYTALYDTLKTLSLIDLTEAMSTLLEATEAAHGHRLESALTDAHVIPDLVDASDIIYCFRARQFDRYFPADEMGRSLHNTMNGMGMIKGDDFGFILDVESRPKKSPRAFCSSVRVPDEVYLVIKPQGGSDDFDSFFHEAGHASHYSRIAPDLEWTLRCLGDTDITESYAFLFNYLTHNPRWLRDILGLPLSVTEEFRRFVLFKKTWFLRRYAAKLQYELTLHSGDPAQTCEAYVPTLEAPLQVHIAPENSLADVDDGFYVAQYLRAWVFEAMLRRFLVQEFGEAWWASRDAGWFLRDWWRRGQQVPLVDLTGEIGFEGLDTRPLVEELMGEW